jgi:phosphatidylserine/phosphatidylglycerophosphate/cardiolipin synthase-like enzyme
MEPQLEPTDGPLLRAPVVWRLEPARRVALLIDGSAYFHAMKAAMRRAQRSILLLGWDLDPHVRLEPDRDAGDPHDRLADFFEQLLAVRPGLEIHVLIWDMAWAYAAQRRHGPQTADRRLPNHRLHYRLDGQHPRGASHHQKVLVVDDAVAFCGGSDFTRNRWDTPEHRPEDARRRTAEGELYGPRHDVMMAVDGAAAAALGDLARERWCRATSLRVAPTRDAGDPWPENLAPDLEDVQVGIARTEPAWRGRPDVREIEALYLRAIAGARRWIYLENQYFTSPVVGDALAARLAEVGGPEVVVVCPAQSGGRGDRLAMDHARNALIGRLQAADRHGRFRCFAALAAEDLAITIHSKIMVVDDWLLRVGSANLNNRSLGFDTECDLAIEAKQGDATTRRAIRRQLERLAAEHVAASPHELGALLERTCSLVASLEVLNPHAGRRLRAFDIPEPGVLDRFFGWTHLLDPLGARDNWRPWKRAGLLRHGGGTTRRS